MRRHEAEGMGAFTPDDSEAGKLLVKHTLPGGERWVAGCGCAVSIPAADDSHMRPTVHAADEHFEWVEPTDQERATVKFIDSPIPAKFRRRSLFRRKG